jgi:hypothetical protein
LKRTTLSAAIDPPPILGRGAVRDTYIALTATATDLLRGAAAGEALSSAGPSRFSSGSPPSAAYGSSPRKELSQWPLLGRASSGLVRASLGLDSEHQRLKISGGDSEPLLNYGLEGETCPKNRVQARVLQG